MRSMGDRNPTSPEALSKLEALSDKRDITKLIIADLEHQLQEAKQSIKDVEQELIGLYATTDIRLREIAEVLEVDNVTVWRKSKELTS